jgi:tetratricopeptide (TPR) repeat protein
MNLSISQAAGYDGGVATSHNYVGIVYDNSGQYHQAIEHYAMAGEIHRRLGHTEQYISSLENMGVACYTLGELDRAEEHYREALRISEANGLLRSDGLLMMCLASVASQRGDYPAAMEMLKRSLAINETIGDKVNRAYTLHEMAYIHHITGDSERALGSLGESERIKEESGDQWGQATSINQIARILTDCGKLDEAAAWLEKGDRMAAPVDNPDLFCRLAVARGRLALEQGNIDAAVAAKDRAIEQSNKAMLKAGRAEAILLWARIDDARGFRRSAEGRYQEALGLYQETGDRLGQGTVQYYHGLSRAAAGRPGEAREQLTAAADIFHSIGAAGWLKLAEQALAAVAGTP